MLPATLPHLVYQGVVDDLSSFLKKEVPIGHRNIVVLADKIMIDSDVVYPSTYTDVPANIHILCQTLVITRNPGYKYYSIDLSGENAPNMHSFNDDKQSQAMKGKAGCDGGSITVYAVKIAGDGNLCIKTQGGNGGKGQDGYKGKPGAQGEDTPWYAPITFHTTNDGENGENGGNGGSGGQGGKSGKIYICLCENEGLEKFKLVYEGGKGGKGGTKGLGGSGGPGGGWLDGAFSGKTGHAGQDGQDGPVGNTGETSKCQIKATSDVDTFFKLAPVTAVHLQRAINTETLQMIKAQQEKNHHILRTVRTNLEWISEIAKQKKYSLIKKRCRELIIKSYEDITHILKVPKEIPAVHVKTFFQEFEEVISKYFDTGSSKLPSIIQKDPKVKIYSQFIRTIQNLETQHNINRREHRIVKTIAQDHLHPLPTFNDESEKELSRKFPELFFTQLKKQYAKEPDLDNIMSKNASELHEGFPGFKPAGGGIPGFKPNGGYPDFIPPEIEELGPEFIIGAVYLEYFCHKVGDMINRIEEDLTERIQMHKEEIEKYRKEVQDRAKQSTQNRSRLRADKRERDPPERRQPEEEEISESGKFIGVLDKCEQVEGESELVVATFDSIKLEFTLVEGEEPVDLNINMDEIQREEFWTQLELQSSALCSVLPAFTFTTILPIEQASEEDIGSWYEFDVDFESESNTSDAVTIVTALDIVLGKLSKTVCGVAESRVPVTISSVTKLNFAIQEEIVEGLDLLPYSPIKAAGTDLNELAHEVNSTLQGDALLTPGSFANISKKIKHAGVGLADLMRMKEVRSEKNEGKAVEQTEQAVQQQARPKITKVTVANVGQGSCNILYDDNGNPRVLFDAGVGGKGSFRTLTEDSHIHMAPVIVISHWDLDHYCYLLLYATIRQNKTIIAPTFGAGQTVFARRVSQSLRRQNPGRYYSVNSTNYQNIPMLPNWPENVTLRLTNANVIGINKNKNNISAITLSVKDNNGNLLMPGDASYPCIAEDQQMNLKYLVATHHGSTNRIGTPPQALPPKGLGATVYFSYGLKNRYGHSVATAMPTYIPRGWVNYRTTLNPPNQVGIDIQLV